jgi:AcrR family transcriptional regulator
LECIEVTGLRDRKKREVRRRIICAAAARFAADGLDGTTLEDVAAAADVSVGTIYNYFGTKNALLLAGVAEDTAVMVAEGQTVLTRPGTNPARAVQRLMGVYLERLLAWEPALLREVVAASFERTRGREVTAELVRMDERLIEQLTTLLGGFQQRGRLRSDVDPAEATMLLFSAMVMQLLTYLAMEWSDERELLAHINRQIEIAFHGLATASDPEEGAA